MIYFLENGVPPSTVTGPLAPSSSTVSLMAAILDLAAC